MDAPLGVGRVLRQIGISVITKITSIIEIVITPAVIKFVTKMPARFLNI
jgi:hypothetical protein